MGHSFDPLKFAIYLFVLIYSCILHECAHVWVALRLGDRTGKDLGRLTLNPLPHIDPFWTIILPALTYLTRGGMIGGPKPAPVNPLNFKNPRTGFMWTSLAGPATNILLAVAGLGILWLLFRIAPEFVGAKILDRETGEVTGYDISWNAIFLTQVMFTNVFLATFNLLPVPPLDGSRFLQFILGRRSDALFDKMERLGILPMLLVAYFIAPYAFRPMFSLLHVLLVQLFPPQYAIALLRTFYS